MKPNNRLALVLIIGMGLFLASCSHNDVYNEFHSFPQAVWKRNNPAVFDVEIKDLSAEYSVLLEIRNSNEYSFQNLWLYVDVLSPTGTIVKDSFNVELADVYGKWHGTGLSLYSHSHPYRTNYHFPDTGTYRFRVIQGMRQAVIPGISDIGLTVAKE